MTVPSARSDVSVIVSAYQQAQSVAFVLRALVRQTVRPGEVLIADDGTNPPLSESVPALAGKLPFPVRYVWQPDDGFRAARSRNNAIHAAHGEPIAFLDQDCLPHAGWLDAHLRHIGPGRVCLARILALDAPRTAALMEEQVDTGAFEKPSWYDPRQMAKLRSRQRKYAGYALMRRLGLPFKSTRPSLSSGNASAWKEDLVRVNGFDEAYIGWGQEDDDLGRRLYMAGVRPVPLLTKAFATHLYHELRHGDWREGPNLARYRTRPASCRCERGLADHPHADVRIVTHPAAQGRFQSAQARVDGG